MSLTHMDIAGDAVHAARGHELEARRRLKGPWTSFHVGGSDAYAVMVAAEHQLAAKTDWIRAVVALFRTLS